MMRSRSDCPFMLRSIRQTRRQNLALLNFCRNSKPLSCPPRCHFSSTSTPASKKVTAPQRWFPKSRWSYSIALLAIGGVGTIVYNVNDPFRHTCLAVIRCSRVARTCLLGYLVKEQE